MNTAKNRLHRSCLALAFIGSLLASAPAQAATQGTLGTTSTGNITINATISGLVQISNLSDLSFSSLTGTTDTTLSENVCVWSNTSTKNYTIKATGNGTASAFTLASGSNAPLPYGVSWAATSGASSGTSLTTNTTSAAFASTATSPLCSTTPTTTATLFVTITAANQYTMVANASYTGILTLLVTPQ